MPGQPPVSVVVPARDAGATIGAALDSLLAQTSAEWEAIVVDDGSADDTARIAGAHAERDPRIRLVSQPPAGVSAARNAGIALARHDWLLFLDADDWLAPDALERLTAPLTGDRETVLAYGGCERAFERGGPSAAIPFDAGDDPAAAFAHSCPMSIHAAVVRRALVEELGGFDVSLPTCEDWDLWRRVARAGGRWERVPGVVAAYRVRAAGASNAARQVLADGLRVVERTHAGDRAEELPAARLAFACWPAALAIGAGEDPVTVLAAVAQDRDPHLDPGHVAACLFDAVPLPTARPYADWTALWDEVGEPIRSFLEALERHAGAPALAHRTLVALERAVLHASPRPRPVTLTATHAVAVELTEPIEDVATNAERLVCNASWQGAALGACDLPVCGGVVPAAVLADTLADRFHWDVLGRVLDEQPLAWETFLRAFWDRPGGFYDASLEERAPERREARDGALAVECADPLPDLVAGDGGARVVVTVGGAPVDALAVPAGTLGAHALRVAITRAAGAELARAAVREGLLGRPPGVPLRAALSAAAVARPRAAQPPGATAIGRRAGAVPGTAASRRARLPRGARDELLRAADGRGDPVLAGGDGVVDYLPEERAEGAADGRAAPQATAPVAWRHDRAFFESLFATRPDPWDYGNAYEQTKYEQTLSLLPGRPRRALELGCAEGRFTEMLAPRVGELLAADVSQVALDRAAVRCAAHANVAFQRLDLVNDPLPGDQDLVVCSEVLYYLADPDELRAVAAKLAGALAPGGQLLSAHAHVLADEPRGPGWDWDVPFGARTIGRALARAPGLRLVTELRTHAYRIALLRREPARRLRLPRRARVVREHAADPPPAIAGLLRPRAERREDRAAPALRTERLPILMYHSIADAGPPALARWRVTPDAFEEQLRFLRDAGYRSITLDEWRDAALTHTPIDGRAVVLTFDDGYRDFALNAWPALRRHGFSATVFLVSGAVGTTNSWDRTHGEPVELMGWDEIAQLEHEGVRFGSHCATHRPLTALAVDEVARELAGSMADLGERLRHPVDAVAYPYGDVDEVVRHLAGGCGYVYGLTCLAGPCWFDLPLTGLARIEVEGTDTLARFVRRLWIG